MDVGTAKARLERLVLLFDAIQVDDEGRPVEFIGANIGFDAGSARNSGACRKIGYVCVHWSSPSDPAIPVSRRRPLSSSEDVTVAT